MDLGTDAEHPARRLSLHPVQAGVDVAVAAATAGPLPAHARTRLWALLLTGPMLLVVRVLIDWAYGHLALG